MINTTWLTINRRCNLNCKWCYAKNAVNSREMTFDLAKKLIDISVHSGTKRFLLIGGEPTIHSSFFEILKYILRYDVSVVIVTNGITLQSRNFCHNIIELDSKRVHMGISLKGSCEDDYIFNCGSTGYSNVLDGISNCSSMDLNYSLSYVISSENIDSLINFAHAYKNDIPDKHIFFEMCNDEVPINEGNLLDNKNVMIEMGIKFSKIYQELDQILGSKMILHQIFPLCFCDKNVLEEMKSKNQVITSCHVYGRKGLIFDVDGSILMCNHLAGYSFGEFGRDYWNYESFKSYWNSDYAIGLHKSFTTMPSMDCLECESAIECGGGCCFQWFSQSFESYKKFIKEVPYEY